MSFKDLHLEKQYESLKYDIVQDFYLPVLNESQIYKRAVGYFNSAALLEIAVGLNHLALSKGKMQLIVSPNLTDEDIESIRLGYKKREEIIEAALLRDLTPPTNKTETIKFNLLANLIAENVLDVKVAFKIDVNSAGILHRKFGIFIDKDNNRIAFEGSMNETYAGFRKNGEAIDVFCSWNEAVCEYVDIKERDFDRYWDNLDNDMEVIPFPQIAIDKLNKYKEETNTSTLLKNEVVFPVSKKNKFFTVPSSVELHDYQNEAIDNWLNNNACGLFDMATGTGKTYTALGALSALSKKLENKLFVVIVCPYQHLVEQWTEDIEKFNVKPIKAYSHYEWKRRVSNLIMSYNINDSESYCVITTNATFSSIEFQSLMTKIKGNMCLVVDEVHNVGAESLRKCLLPNFTYRLGLSATIDRYHDDEGTDAILDYFGKVVYRFSLEQAIGVFLTEYKYYIVPVYLTNDEWDEYSSLSYAIGKNVKINSLGKSYLTEYGKKLAIKRARVIAGAKNKIMALEKELLPYKNDTHILVYCGATKMPDFFKTDKGDKDEELIKQTKIVMDCIGNHLGMSVSQFTAEEDVERRSLIKERFKAGDRQVLVAIKCLDEGVNIPMIKTAFILSSTTNPKEYIQRRGRVLRQYDGKLFSEIYDFVTLPRNPDLVKQLTSDEMLKEKKLVLKELRRVNEFARLAINKGDCYQYIEKLKKCYCIDNDELKINYSDEEV